MLYLWGEILFNCKLILICSTAVLAISAKSTRLFLIFFKIAIPIHPDPEKISKTYRGLSSVCFNVWMTLLTQNSVSVLGRKIFPEILILQFKNRLLTNFCYLGIFGRMYWKKTKITARTTTIRNNKSRVFPIVNYFYLNRVYSEIFALKNFSSANFKPAKIATPKKVAKTATR